MSPRLRVTIFPEIAEQLSPSRDQCEYSLGYIGFYLVLLINLRQDAPSQIGPFGSRQEEAAPHSKNGFE